jgi:hypothetical protein
MIHIDIYLFPLLTFKVSVEECVYIWFINADDEKREDRAKSWSYVTYANILIYDTRTVNNALCREL